MPLEMPQTMPAMTTITGRFELEPLAKKHYEDIAAILEDEHIWAQGFGDTAQRPLTHEERIDFIDHFMLMNNRRLWAIIDNATGVAIGTTGLAENIVIHERCHIGRTIISPAHWGKRINHEVKLALMDWLFDCGAGRIECDVDAINARSGNSLLSFGFTHEGVRRRASQRWDGTWRDLQIFSVIREEWEEIRLRNALGLMERFGSMDEQLVS
jgi:RimJ/RimL family protein N-acetyltransferase